MFSTVLLIAGTSFSQKVTNNLSFSKGAKLEITTTLSTVAEIMGGEVITNASAVRILDVEEMKDGIATIESKIKRMQFSLDGMGQSHAFDSENESDLKGERGKVAEKGLKNKYSMRVDNKGNIIDVVPDDDNPNGKDEDQGADSDLMMTMIKGAAQGMDLPKSGDKIDFAILPDRELAKGDSWTDNESTIKEITRNATYTIANITADQITVDFTEETSGKVARQNMGIEMIMDQTEKSTGKIIIDKATGLMKEKTVTRLTEGTMEAMGQTMPINTKTTIKETVTVSK